MIHFFITYLMLLLVSGIFISQFYHLSRHYKEVQPDNTVKVKGFLLKKWSMVWEYQKGAKKIYYSGEALIYKYKLLEEMFSQLAHKFHLSLENKSLVLNKGETLLKLDKSNFEKLIDCQYEINDDAYFLFIEEPIYLFPKWVRNPLSSCPICMSSVFGSFFWLSINYLNHNLFYWTNHKTVAFFLFWFIFIVVLSQLCAIIYRKTYEFV